MTWSRSTWDKIESSSRPSSSSGSTKSDKHKQHRDDSKSRHSSQSTRVSIEKQTKDTARQILDLARQVARPKTPTVPTVPRVPVTHSVSSVSTVPTVSTVPVVSMEGSSEMAGHMVNPTVPMDSRTADSGPVVALCLNPHGVEQSMVGKDSDVRERLHISRLATVGEPEAPSRYQYESGCMELQPAGTSSKKVIPVSGMGSTKAEAIKPTVSSVKPPDNTVTGAKKVKPVSVSTKPTAASKGSTVSKTVHTDRTKGSKPSGRQTVIPEPIRTTKAEATRSTVSVHQSPGKKTVNPIIGETISAEAKSSNVTVKTATHRTKHKTVTSNENNMPTGTEAKPVSAVDSTRTCIAGSNITTVIGISTDNSRGMVGANNNTNTYTAVPIGMDPLSANLTVGGPTVSNQAEQVAVPNQFPMGNYFNPYGQMPQPFQAPMDQWGYSGFNSQGYANPYGFPYYGNVYGQNFPQWSVNTNHTATPQDVQTSGLAPVPVDDSTSVTQSTSRNERRSRSKKAHSPSITQDRDHEDGISCPSNYSGFSLHKSPRNSASRSTHTHSELSHSSVSRHSSPDENGSRQSSPVRVTNQCETRGGASAVEDPADSDRFSNPRDSELQLLRRKMRQMEKELADIKNKPALTSKPNADIDMQAAINEVYRWLPEDMCPKPLVAGRKSPKKTKSRSDSVLTPDLETLSLPTGKQLRNNLAALNNIIASGDLANIWFPYVGFLWR